MNAPAVLWDLGLCSSAYCDKVVSGIIRDQLSNSLIPQAYYRKSWTLFTYKKVYYCHLLHEKETYDVSIKSSINYFLSFKGLIVVCVYIRILSRV
jgi:hypothetical protein